ncbi:MAG: benzodiazepine receptor TspO [Deltaproteobacteria bacterium]|nr:benzodiazepine receptor TspO [Deltaproteobacteria bacterium]
MGTAFEEGAGLEIAAGGMERGAGATGRSSLQHLWPLDCGGSLKAADIPKLVFYIIVCQLAGGIGSYFTRPAIPTWYATLKKPLLTPPDWVFAPVWITLYVLMGISVFLVWRETRYGKPRQKALFLFWIQLGLNAFWSYLFFGLHSPLAGLVGIIALVVCIFLTLRIFLRISFPAGLLLIPYLLWVGYAAGLNFSIYILNC